MVAVSKTDIDKTIALVYNRYTKANYLSSLRAFLGCELTPSAIQSIVSGWHDLSESTISARRSALKRLIAYKALREECDASVLNSVSFPKGRPAIRRRALSMAELERFVAATETTGEQLLTMILFDSGLRAGSVPKIKYGDLQEVSFKIQVKMGRNVEIYPTDSMAALGAELMGASGASQDHFIFTTSAENPISYKSVYMMFKRIAARAKIEGIVSHSARHTFATRLSDTGASIVSISGLMGHRKAETTMGYIHPNRRLMQEAIQSIAIPRRDT